MFCERCKCETSVAGHMSWCGGAPVAPAPAGMDMEALRRDLTEGFVMREYTQLYGPMGLVNREDVTRAYRNDSIFHARVQKVVGDVMVIIQKHFGGKV